MADGHDIEDDPLIAASRDYEVAKCSYDVDDNFSDIDDIELVSSSALPPMCVPSHEDDY